MRVHYAMLALALSLATPMHLAAQQTGSGGATGSTGAGQTGTTGDQTTGTGTQTGTTGQTAATQDLDTGAELGPIDSHWLASGFVGSSFGAATEGAAPDFGGSIGFLWNGWVGGEFVAGFTPNFQVQEIALFAGEEPEVNSYMANAIAAVPLGVDGQWQPYVSGGFGAVTLRSSALNVESDNAVENVFEPDDTKPGGNIGAGVMGFVGAVGIRGDVRYFRAFETDNADSDDLDSPAETIGEAVLPGLDFWRANIGIAFRW